MSTKRFAVADRQRRRAVVVRERRRRVAAGAGDRRRRPRHRPAVDGGGRRRGDAAVGAPHVHRRPLAAPLEDRGKSGAHLHISTLQISISSNLSIFGHELIGWYNEFR